MVCNKLIFKSLTLYTLKTIQITEGDWKTVSLRLLPPKQGLYNAVVSENCGMDEGSMSFRHFAKDLPFYLIGNSVTRT